jgi:hypothetical protein
MSAFTPSVFCIAIQIFVPIFKFGAKICCRFFVGKLKMEFNKKLMGGHVGTDGAL